LGAVAARGLYFLKFKKDRRNITDYPTKKGVVKNQELLKGNLKYFCQEKYEKLFELIDESLGLKTFNYYLW
jgi:hypothetical protein